MNNRLLTSLIVFSGLAIPQTAPERWITTWAASPQQPAALPPAGAPATGPGGQALPPPVIGFNNQTVRMIVHTSTGGRRVRVQLSNAFGTSAVQVGAARIALRAKDSAIVSGSDHALTFNGKPAVAIPPGALLVSDPVNLELPPLSDVAVSLYFPGDTGPATRHATGLHSTYISKTGNFASAPSIDDPGVTNQSWYFLSGLQIAHPAGATAVTFGDSITDGARSTPNTDSSWPSALSRRLLANPETSAIAVANQGISGNRVLRDGAGINALARFDRDALSQAGAKWVFVLEGINDIGLGARANGNPADAVTTDELTGGLRQLADRAHAHGLRIVGCTLTPYEGAAYYSEKGETIRQAVNQWIRSSGTFDDVVDFDAVTRDPEHPKQFRKDFDSGDHLHPGDAGYKAMADAVDLSIFKR